MVIDFEAKRKERTLTGNALCLGCKHKWEAVAPVGTVALRCPECETNRGMFINLVDEGEIHRWNCNCGNDLFYISPESIYCPVCGNRQTF